MINKVILVGNVGADPEVRSLESGVKTARVQPQSDSLTARQMRVQSRLSGIQLSSGAVLPM